MKKIEAIIKPAKVREVKQALIEAGVRRMTVSEVKEFGLVEGHLEIYRGTECFVDFVHNAKIEIVVPEGQADKIVEVITRSGSAGTNGGPEILVYTLDQGHRVSTTELAAVAA